MLRPQYSVEERIQHTQLTLVTRLGYKLTPDSALNWKAAWCLRKCHVTCCFPTACLLSSETGDEKAAALPLAVDAAVAVFL